MDEVDGLRVDRIVLKVGDLVKHRPEGSFEGVGKQLFEDWGWLPDFDSGVILEVTKDKACVFYTDINLNPQPTDIRWFPTNELKRI